MAKLGRCNLGVYEEGKLVDEKSPLQKREKSLISR